MNKKRFLGLCAILIGLVFCVVGFWILFRPTQFEATVKIKLEEERTEPGISVPYDPFFLETELNTIRGDVVLRKVVETLDLNVEWSKRDADRNELSTSETTELLRRRMYITSIPNTRLVEIRVRDENADEAARIANAIAEAYGDYRIVLHRREMKMGIENLEKQYETQATNIAQMEARALQLRQRINSTDAGLLDEYIRSNAPTRLDREQKQLLNEENKLVAMISAHPTNSAENLKQSSKYNRLLEQWAGDQLKLYNNRKKGTDLTARYPEYYQAVIQLQDDQNIYEHFKEKIQADKEVAEMPMSKVILVTVIEPAEPPTVSAGPNRWLGAVFLICGIVIAGWGFGSLRASTRMPN